MESKCERFKYIDELVDLRGSFLQVTNLRLVI